jgi:hypothetical protein
LSLKRKNQVNTAKSILWQQKNSYSWRRTLRCSNNKGCQKIRVSLFILPGIILKNRGINILTDISLLIILTKKKFWLWPTGLKLMRYVHVPMTSLHYHAPMLRKRLDLMDMTHTKPQKPFITKTYTENLYLKMIFPAPQRWAFLILQKPVKYIKSKNSMQLVKPVDMSGGKGISKVSNTSHNIAEIIEKAFAVSKAKRIVIEDFVEGTRHGCSALIKNQKVIFSFFDNEHYYINPYLVSAASTPALLSEETKREIIKQSEKIASLLNLKDGIFHVQFISSDSRPIIIEICRRPPGDLYMDLVTHATGVNYPEAILKSFIGEEVIIRGNNTPNGFFTRHCIMSDKQGEISEIRFDSSIESNIIEKVLLRGQDSRIDNMMTDKAGIVFLKFSSMDEMISKTEKMQELIKVVVN